MKKITFILLGLISGTVFAQNSASGSADVQAFIVQPLTISPDGGMLSFGDINKTADGGDVTVQPGASTRDITEADMQITSSTPISSASFNISGAADFTYNISVPSVTLSPSGDGATGEPMKLRPIFKLDENDAVTAAVDGTASQSNSGTGSDQTLTLGGILTVNGNQDIGAYEGEVNVTVKYE